MQRAKLRYLRLKIVNNFPTGYLSRGMLFSPGYWLFAVGGHCLRYPPPLQASISSVEKLVFSLRFGQILPGKFQQTIHF